MYLIAPYTSQRYKVHLTHYKYNNNTFMKNLIITMMHRYGGNK